ncbi:MAG: DUF359 domain-containing protein [Candidatus Micrarchaeota archaeon]
MKKLTERLRMELKKPLGALLNEDEAIAAANANKKMVVAVGDECARTLIKAGAHLDVVVYDLRCMREPVDEETKNEIERFARERAKASAKNPAGYITDELEDAVQKVIGKGNGSVFVDGEEDLAALVAVARAPVGALVLYGQPREGIVAIRVDKRSKEKIARILEGMEKGA